MAHNFFSAVTCCVKFAQSGHVSVRTGRKKTKYDLDFINIYS